MSSRPWGLLAVTLFSVGLASAVEGDAQVKVSPAPLFKDPTTGMELVHVKGGCYRMGDLYDDGESGSGDGQDEKPVHEVCVDDFYMGKYEVTQGQWKSVMGGNPSSDNTCAADDCPVDNMTWRDVQEFMARLNGKAGGSKYRLPTEAEWEYAARSGGKSQRYAGGNDVDSVSWYAANSGYQVNPSAPVAHPVGTKAPNGLGLYNMSGNVYELTGDWYGSTYYSSSPRNNPTGPASGEVRVKRGGCASGHPGNSRTARRSQWNGPDALSGLRLLRIP